MRNDSLTWRWSRLLVGACLIMCLAVACTNHHDVDDSESDDDNNNDDDDSSSARADLTNDRGSGVLNPLQFLADEYVTFSGEPGLGLGIWRAGEEIRSLASGYADLLAGRPAWPDMLYRVGSNTKPFVATVVMQLADEGLLSLDDPLTVYLPQYEEWSNVTILQLLRMQSGIADYTMNEMFWFSAFFLRNVPAQPERMIGFARRQEMLFPPGEGCEYCNTNYVLLGMIIEAVTGRRADEEIRERVTEPLGLQRTFLDTTGKPYYHLVHGYADTEIAGPALGIDSDLTDLTILIPDSYMVTDTMFDGTYLFHPSIFWTAGALVSSPAELTLFMKHYLLGDLVSEEHYEEMMRFVPCTVLGEPVDYSIGIMRKHSPFGHVLGHGGKHFGYSTATYYLPEMDLTYSIIHNYVPDQGRGLQTELFTLAAGGRSVATTVCKPPADFFASEDSEYVHLRFRGIVNENYAPERRPGISFANLKLDGDWTPYYGMDAGATLDWNGAEPVMLIESVGPSFVEGFDERKVVLNITPELLAHANRDGDILVEEDLTPLVAPVLIEMARDPETGRVSKQCINGIPDLSRPSRLFVCDHEDWRFVGGEVARLFGWLAVNRDPADIEIYLALQDRPACQCLGGDNLWHECE